jgi:hypothetical protein
MSIASNVSRSDGSDLESAETDPAGAGKAGKVNLTDWQLDRYGLDGYAIDFVVADQAMIAYLNTQCGFSLSVSSLEFFVAQNKDGTELIDRLSPLEIPAQTQTSSPLED